VPHDEPKVPGLALTEAGGPALSARRSWRSVLHLAEHAVAVYEPDSTHARIVRAAGYRSAFITRGGAQVALCWSKDAVVIACRGSSEGKDWRDNAASIWRNQWRPVLPKGVRVGRGFRRQVDSILDPLVERLKLECCGPDTPGGHEHPPIFVVGHSLGGAMVPLVVAGLDHYGFEVEHAAMFSAPRVGSRRWRDWYDTNFEEKTRSYVNVSGGQTDLVTRIPRRIWGFRHVGERVILDDDGDTLYGDKEWREHKRDHPVDNAQGWRILTRMHRRIDHSLAAHHGQAMLDAVDARLARQLAGAPPNADDPSPR